MNWQSIETAPKDGTPIWALGRIYGKPFQFECEWNGVEWYHGFGDGWRELNPSHWMPLPAAPDAKCRTCSGHGAVGNIVNSEPCPDCTPAPVSSDTERLEWLAREDNCVVCEGVNGFWLCWVDEHDHARSEYQRGSFPTFRAAIDAAKAAAKASP